MRKFVLSNNWTTYLFVLWRIFLWIKVGRIIQLQLTVKCMTGHTKRRTISSMYHPLSKFQISRNILCSYIPEDVYIFTE